MKIAALSATGRGETDRLITQCAEQLQAEGLTLTGIVKVLQDLPPDAHHCDMDVRVLPGQKTLRITQSLGDGSTGCRLNPTAIAEAVAAVEQADDTDADLFVLNKFGPEEAEGRGFCTAIGNALERGIPVLVGVAGNNRAAFDDFAGGMSETLPADLPSLLEWCRAAQREATAA